MNCRFCKAPLQFEFLDLVNAPPSNSFLKSEHLNDPECYYPLKLFVCDQCFLVQIDEYKESRAIFNEDYIYFSSFSSSWLDHAKQYSDMIINRLSLDEDSFVVEVACNDGYLLKNFINRNIPCLGIEPSTKTADEASRKGIDVVKAFFGESLALSLKQKGNAADLLVGNNVLAHVPDINDFVSGLKRLLKKDGTITLEFPHLKHLVEKIQFDTVYHEHFSYFSLLTVKRILDFHGLDLFDVDELSTHGGSLRVYGKHKEDKSKEISHRVHDILNSEKTAGMDRLNYYMKFQEQVNLLKNRILLFLIEQKEKNKKVIAYGAAAKGNTLINYCGIKKDLIEFVVDASIYKQNKFLPGSHIPVTDESKIQLVKPDYIIIQPWNLKDEIMAQLRYIRAWGGRFVTFIPKLEILT